MLNFFEIKFNRVIIHKIIAKTKDSETASVVLKNQIINLDQDSELIIIDRLNEATKSSKFFNLTIENTLESSFFGYAKDLHDSSDQDFIKYSGKIAQILADSQSLASVPGGFLIVAEGKLSSSQRKVVVVIKAESQDALYFENYSLKTLNDIFLSPSRKFFKFGVLYEMSTAEKEQIPFDEYPNNEWAALIFDEQFRPDSSLAEYFYKDFLGFTTFYNDKLQTRRFYVEAERHIFDNILDIDEKRDMIGLLDTEFAQTKEKEEFSPQEFVDKYIHDEELNNTIKEELVANMPSTIKKDISLIKSKLFKKSINFTSKIKISGDTDNINENMEIIQNEDDLKELSTQQDTYTIVKIKGKPI